MSMLLMMYTLLCYTDAPFAMPLVAPQAFQSAFFLPNQTLPSGKRMHPDADVVAILQHTQGRVLFTAQGAYMAVDAPVSRVESSVSPEPVDTQRVVLQTGISRAQVSKRGVQPRLVDPLPMKVHDFRGAQQDWRSHLTVYRSLSYANVWDGVDLSYVTDNGNLSMRFDVTSAHALQDLVLETGASELALNAAGDLVASLAGASLQWRQPRAYQQGAGKRVAVEVAFEPMDEGRVGLQLIGKLHDDAPIHLETELVWGTYFGSSGNYAAGDSKAVAIDDADQIYFTGSTNTSNFPTTVGPLPPSSQNTGTDIFLLKIDGNAQRVLLGVMLGGSGTDVANDLVVDAQQHIYIAGRTTSPDFPTSADAAFPESLGTQDGFVLKLDATGTFLHHATYLGGTGYDDILQLHVNPAVGVTVVGETSSTDLPVNASSYQKQLAGFNDGFCMRLNLSLSEVVFSTYLGGRLHDWPVASHVDGDGMVYIAGETESGDFPVKGKTYLSEARFNRVNAFLTKLASNGSMGWSTLIGGRSRDAAVDMAFDDQQQLYLVGDTGSSDLKITVGQPSLSPRSFLAKFALSDESADLVSLQYLNFENRVTVRAIATVGNDQVFYTGKESSSPFNRSLVSGYFDGSGTPVRWQVVNDGYTFVDLALDSQGNPLVLTNTSVSNLLTTQDAISDVIAGDRDPFLFKLNQADGGLLAATYINFGEGLYGGHVAVDPQGRSLLAGHIASNVFPTTSGVYDTSFNGNWDAFVARFNVDGSALEWLTFLGGRQSENVQDLLVSATGEVYVSGNTNSHDFPTTPNAYQSGPFGYFDAFVSRLSSEGDQLLASTLFGGEVTETAHCLALDHANQVAIAGRTSSRSLPVNREAFDRHLAPVSFDGYVAKFNTAMTQRIFASYIGGRGYDEVNAISFDDQNNLFIAGMTSDPDFPTTTGAFSETFDDRAGTILKLDATGSHLLHSGFVGTRIVQVVQDAQNNICFFGENANRNFPTSPDSVQFGGDFLLVGKLDSQASTLLNAATFGYPGYHYPLSMALDQAGRFYLAGNSDWALFPDIHAGKRNHDERTKAFVVRLSADLKQILNGVRLGGRRNNTLTDMAMDQAGHVFLAGRTVSPDFPVTGGAYDPTGNPGLKMYLSKIAFEDCAVPHAFIPRLQLKACVGSIVTLEAIGAGPGPINYQWFKAGVPIQGATTARYHIAEASPVDSGQYTCALVSDCGETLSEPITLEVSQGGNIDRQPQGVVGQLGQQVTLTLEAHESIVGSFGWYRDEIYFGSGEVLGNRNQLTFTLTEETVGSYMARRYARCGYFYSQPAQVQMLPYTHAAKLLPQTQGAGLTPPRFEVVFANPDNMPTVQWQTFPEVASQQTESAITFDAVPLHPVQVRVQVDYGMGQPVIEQWAHYLYTPSEIFRDFNGDAQQTEEDLLQLLQFWQLPFEGDADGDGRITILDTLYLPALAPR